LGSRLDELFKKFPAHGCFEGEKNDVYTIV
jgi:hypothetical protein